MEILLSAGFWCLYGAPIESSSAIHSYQLVRYIPGVRVRELPRGHLPVCFGITSGDLMLASAVLGRDEFDFPSGHQHDSNDGDGHEHCKPKRLDELVSETEPVSGVHSASLKVRKRIL